MVSLYQINAHSVYGLQQRLIFNILGNGFDAEFAGQHLQGLDKGHVFGVVQHVADKQAFDLDKVNRQTTDVLE